MPSGRKRRQRKFSLEGKTLGKSVEQQEEEMETLGDRGNSDTKGRTTALLTATDHATVHTTEQNQESKMSYGLVNEDLKGTAHGSFGETFACQMCGQPDSVSFDYVHGLLVCEECGAILPTQDLVAPVEFNKFGEPEGVLVGAKDTGADISARHLHHASARKAVQRSRPYDPVVPLRKILTLQSSKLQLAKNIVEEAESYVERIAKNLRGAWRRDILVSSAIYLAIRLNNVPLTLLDMTKQNSIDIFTLGKYYRAAAELVGIQVPPHVDARLLLPRLVHGIQSKCPGTWGEKVGADAQVVLEWMSKREIRGMHPLTSAGAAIVIALEMNQINASIEQVAQLASTSSSALRKKLRSVKNEMIECSKYLPYNSNVKSANVASYAKAIMKITALPTRTRQIEPMQPVPLPPFTSEMNLTSTKRIAQEDTHDIEGIITHMDDTSALGDMSDTELEGYIRSPEEVEAYEKIQSSLTEHMT